MPKQPAFPGLRDAMKKKQTRREKFLSDMEAVVPWTRLLALIEPHYPKAEPKGSRPPMPLEMMLRIYLLQNWYALSDPMAEETLYDSDALRRFAGIELGDDRIPDETTILNFRHLLEKHQLTEKLFAEVNSHLADQGITLRSGTLVDATIIDAPSSTKNEDKARDPEMSSTRKGNDWYFGMKAHVGVYSATNWLRLARQSQPVCRAIPGAQARPASAQRDRADDRPHENGWPPRPLCSQGHAR